MHIPDGFINAGTSAGAAVVAVGGLAICARRAAVDLAEKQAPMAGLVAAFIFALQMLNFPVAGGTSGHLLGGVLAAVLVGPWAGAMCISVVLFVQALFFADGGLSALGLNVVNMALVSALGGYVIFVALRKILPKTKPSISLASGVAAGCAVVLASLGFTLEYAIGGNGAASMRTVVLAMAGTHANPYRTTDPHRLARTPIQHSDGMRFFMTKTAGGMRMEDALRVSANRWRYRSATT